MPYTKTSLIGDVLDQSPHLAEHFMQMGMHCLGCPSARSESLEEACAVHEIDVDELLAKLNAK